MSFLRCFLFVLLLAWPFPHEAARKSDENDGSSGKKKSSREPKKNKLVEDVISVAQVQFMTQQRVFVEKWITWLKNQEDMKQNKFQKEIGREWTGDDYFNAYNRRMSLFAEAAHTNLFFMSIGACDGTEDPTINLFVKNPHWEGLFVEPMDLNVRDLRVMLQSRTVLNRSIIVQAAATAVCRKPTLTFSRPLFEQINKSNEHWLRRQIGGVIEKGSRADWPDWKDETVKCTTGPRLISEWSDRFYYKSIAKHQKQTDHYRTSSLSRLKRRIRPHVLRVDVEGHDFEVVKGFLIDNMRMADLPLTILFEAKVVGVWHNTTTTFNDLRVLLQRAGYVVTDEHHDTFAVLRPEMITVQGSKLNPHLNPEWTLARYKQRIQSGQLNRTYTFNDTMTTEELMIQEMRQNKQNKLQSLYSRTVSSTKGKKTSTEDISLPSKQQQLETQSQSSLRQSQPKSLPTKRQRGKQPQQPQRQQPQQQQPQQSEPQPEAESPSQSQSQSSLRQSQPKSLPVKRQRGKQQPQQQQQQQQG